MRCPLGGSSLRHIPSRTPNRPPTWTRPARAQTPLGDTIFAPGAPRLAGLPVHPPPAPLSHLADGASKHECPVGQPGAPGEDEGIDGQDVEGQDVKQIRQHLWRRGHGRRGGGLGHDARPTAPHTHPLAWPIRTLQGKQVGSPSPTKSRQQLSGRSWRQPYLRPHLSYLDRTLHFLRVPACFRQRPPAHLSTHLHLWVSHRVPQVRLILVDVFKAGIRGAFEDHLGPDRARSTGSDASCRASPSTAPAPVLWPATTRPSCGAEEEVPGSGVMGLWAVAKGELGGGGGE